MRLPLTRTSLSCRDRYLDLLLRTFSLFWDRCVKCSISTFPCLVLLLFYSFLLRVFSDNITSPQFQSSYLSMSTHFHLSCSHVRISRPTSSSVVLSTWPNHLTEHDQDQDNRRLHTGRPTREEPRSPIYGQTFFFPV